jgi:Spy/CpxP family protein refolding chaperone
VREALSAEPFDSNKLEQALAELRTQTSKNQELLQRALVEAAREATPEVRRELAHSFGHGSRHER